MSLILKVVSAQAPAMGAAASREFGPEGGVVGRAAGSDWVLPDPEKFVSGSHFQVIYENGVYLLSDTSTNGTFINDTAQPVGQGAPVQLHDGDRLLLGEYEIVVSLPAAPAAMQGPSTVPGAVTDPFAAQSTVPPPSPTGGFQPPAQDPFQSAPPTDPLEALERASAHQTGPVSGWPQDSGPAADWPSEDKGAMGSSSSPLADHMDVPSPQRTIPPNWDDTHYGDQGSQGVPPPPAASGIPDNWDETSFEHKSAAPPPQPVEQQPPPSSWPPHTDTRTMQPDQFTQQPAAPSVADDALMSFLAGAGIDPAQVPPNAGNYLMQVAGQIFREVVQGMMEVLTARAALKNEFRISLTTIQPVQNNPLKFSLNVDAAIENLLLRHGEGYLEPLEAIGEGFDDIKHHQLAMIAGMRAAFNSILQQLSPQELLTKFEKSKGGLLGKSRGRNWQLYSEMMDELNRDPDASFRDLFGDEFTRAYEEQMTRLGTRRR